MPKLHVVHHGLRDRRSHFYGEAKGWVAACRERGIDRRLYVHDTAPLEIVRELAALPVFGHRAGTATVAQLSGQGNADVPLLAGWFAASCAALDGEGVEAEDRVVVTFASEVEVLGIAEWLGGRVPERRPTVSLIFHREPCLNAVITEDRTGIIADFPDFIRGMMRMKSLLPAERLRLYATTPHLSALLRSVAQHPCEDAPHPTFYLAEDVLAAVPEPPAHVCVAGQLRVEKGSELVSEVLLRFAEMRPGKRLTVQANEEEDARVVANRLASCQSPYSVYFGELGHAPYQRHLAQSDIVLLPYDWRRYALRASGVFSEAVGFGAVVVVPDRTWMADNLNARRGGGTIFREQTAGSILEALIDASDNRAALRVRALESMQAWRRDHSTAALLEKILRPPPMGGAA